MPVPIPSIEEQTQIVAEVERRLSIVDEIESQIETSLKRAARLRQGILKRAFEGRLVPQDPNDEPAEQLLARIRAGRRAQPSANGKPRTPRRGRTRTGESDRPLLNRMEGASEGGEP